MQIFIDMDLQADIPFSFSIELVGGMALSPQPVQLIEGLAATPSWHGADVKATSTLCYDAYSGIYLTLLLMPLEKTPLSGITTWASIHWHWQEKATFRA